MWVVKIERPDYQNDWHTVAIVGPFKTKAEAQAMADRVPDNYWPLGHAGVWPLTNHGTYLKDMK